MAGRFCSYVVLIRGRYCQYPAAIQTNKEGMSMMRLRVEKIGEGLHPSELVISVETRSGPEEAIIHPTSLQDDSVNIGWPVGREGNYFLVELPRPTISGTSRVWVSKDALIPDEGTRAIA
jgi:hypothetical protein